MSANIESAPQQDYEDRPVALMTSMYFPDSARLPIALRTLKAYQEEKIPTVLIDASPDDEVPAKFRELGAVVLDGADLRLATSAIKGAEYIRANGGDRIIKHEPEKDLMPRFAREINRALDDNDIVVIGRTPEAKQSLPRTMRETETIGGRLMSERLGLPADSLSGGRAFARSGTDALINYDHRKWGDNWMHLHVPIIESIRDGRPVGGVKVPLMYPEEMIREEEDNVEFENKRAMQLQLHTALIEQYLKDNPEYKKTLEERK